MAEVSLNQVNETVLQATRPPRPFYYWALGCLAMLIGMMGCLWMYQVRTGMGVAGISHPVGWGVYIANFVFWVGIAHSGTLISAILYLFRAKWRNAVSRSAEAMTVIAVMTAGLFPLIHLGRVWVFYYILPYPSQRQLWPNFKSPLVFDVIAVSTYFTVSAIFFYVGMIPDLAAARDRAYRLLGVGHWRSRLYRVLSLGWEGAGSQWWHYGRSYLFFAVLATPLVISVHSVVSWDFALGILPGWHTTIYAPYFVAGAIHSGLAMVLTLMIPMRRILKLEKLITVGHLEAVAKTILVTTLIVGYSYAVEAAVAWYSNDIFEHQFIIWRATGSIAWLYWLLIPLNVLIPLMFIFRRIRRSLIGTFVISIAVNIGMWSERYHLITASTAHDFMPHAWGSYCPTFVEVGITLGAFSFFFFLFLVFAKIMPVIPISEMKEEIAEKSLKEYEHCHSGAQETGKAEPKLLLQGLYADPDRFLDAIKKIHESGYKVAQTYSPIKMEQVDDILGRPSSPVRYWTLAGAIFGVISGFALAIGASRVNDLIVGGKSPVALVPYCVVGFELAVLFGALANLAGLIVHSRLWRIRQSKDYDPRFANDHFGLTVACPAERFDELKAMMDATGPEETHVTQS